MIVDLTQTKQESNIRRRKKQALHLILMTLHDKGLISGRTLAKAMGI